MRATENSEAIRLSCRLERIEKKLAKMEARLGAMYKGDLSPESRLAAYAIIVESLQKRVAVLQNSNLIEKV